MAIGSEKSTGALFGHGAVYVTFLTRSGNASFGYEIGPASLPLLNLTRWDYFGSSIAGLSDPDGDPIADGDFNGDGQPDVAVGAPGDSRSTGAVYLIFLASTGVPRDFVKLAGSNQQLSPRVLALSLGVGEKFGTSVAVRKNDDNGLVLAIGAPGYNDDIGAVYVLSLELVASSTTGRRLSTLSPSLVGSMLRISPSSMSHGDSFGSAVAWIADIDGDGLPDLAVGAPGATASSGAVHLVSSVSGDILGTISSPQPQEDNRFGASVVLGPDWEGNGDRDLMIGVPGEDGGAIYVFPASTDQSVYVRWSSSDFNVPAHLGFGESAAVLGLVNDDLVSDLAVGVPQYGDVEGAVVIAQPLLVPYYPPNPPNTPYEGRDNLLRNYESSLPGYGIGLIVLFGVCILFALVTMYREVRARQVARAMEALQSTVAYSLQPTDINVEAGKPTPAVVETPTPVISTALASKAMAAPVASWPSQVGGPKCTPLPSAESFMSYGGRGDSAISGGAGVGVSSSPSTTGCALIGIGDLQGHFTSGEDLSSTPRPLDLSAAGAADAGVVTSTQPPLASPTSDGANALLTRI
mmetsp:Transcript_3617/g.7815  ORF Transcript_3617/g.7815 Transcript_3617/m.7815 type:complete len:578 (-) Transcript_3617:389-2122(-)